MNKNRQIYLFIFVLFSLSLGIETSYAIDVTTGYLISNMQQSRNKLKNLQCKVDYTDHQSDDARKMDFESVKQGNAPDHLIKMFKDKLDPSYELRYQTQTIALDEKGRAKVEIKMGNLDGKKKTDNLTLHQIDIWDGEKSILYNTDVHNTEKDISYAVINDKPHPNIDNLRRPSVSFGGNFIEALSKAMDQEKKINIKKINETYQVTFIDERGIKNIGIIDPAKGFSVLKYEKYKNDVLDVGFTAEFQEYQNGVWFPKNGTIESFFSNGMLDTTTNVSITDVKINDPEFTEDLFKLDFPKGTLVTDLKGGVNYTVGDTFSFKMLDDSGRPLNIITNPANIEYENNNKLFFIPLLETSLDKELPCFFDLEKKELITFAKKMTIEESFKYLSMLGKNCIAWDNKLMATANIKMSSEVQKLFEYTDLKWGKSYKFPKKIELPYACVMTTGSNTNYLINIKKINPDGIWISL